MVMSWRLEIDSRAHEMEREVCIARKEFNLTAIRYRLATDQITSDNG